MSTFKGFTTVQLSDPKRSKFDLSHEKRITSRMGRLTPVFVTETLPNDTFRCNTEVMIRLAPLISPIMHRVNMFVHFFFVPMRLIWNDKEWEKFITGGRLGPGIDAPPVPPNVNVTAVQGRAQSFMNVKSLADYLGLGTISDGAGGYGNVKVDIAPFGAMYKIWYDYYRDRNYVADNTFLPLQSGTLADTTTIDALFSTRNRDWQHDYFTSALPWTQRGNEVLMPLSGSGTVSYLANSLVKRTDGANTTANKLLGYNSIGAAVSLKGEKDINTTAGTDVRIENISGVNITTSDVSINDLRRSLALQTWMERNALGGSRLPETIWAHFHRRTSDGRLQVAEYLGGGKVTLGISEVLTTAFSEDDTPTIVPPGNMAGHSKTFGNTNRFTYNCEEWGFIIGVMSVMPNSAYMQGSHRMFFGRNDFLSYPWPAFAHLGEQEVFKYELFQDATTTPLDRTTQPVFGYQSRYADWKYIASSSHGDFKTSLEHWHLSRKFSSIPTLGAAFCTFEDALQDRVFAVSAVDTLWCYIYNNCSVIRSLPYYGTPKMV